MDVKSWTQPVVIDVAAIQTLDLKALNPWMERPLTDLLSAGAGLELQYNWPRDADDPRELSECPEPRLWALRADAVHPWLPLVLERSGGSLIQLGRTTTSISAGELAPNGRHHWLRSGCSVLDPS